MIVHINEEFLEDDELDTYEESNIYGIVSKNDMTWPRHKSSDTKSENLSQPNKIEYSEPAIKTVDNTIAPDNRSTISSRFRKWFIKTCICTKKSGT